MARENKPRGTKLGAPPGVELSPGSLVLVDAAPLVYLVEGESGSARRAAVESALAAIAGAGARVVASALVWTELLQGPARRGDPVLASAYRSLLSDSSRILIEPVEVAIAEEAARLRASRPLGLADSIHIATARMLGASAILGNDEAWRRVPECPPLLLVDELAFEAGGGS